MTKRWIAWLLTGLLIFTCLPFGVGASEVTPVNIIWSSCDDGEGWATENSCGTMSVTDDYGYSGSSVEVDGQSQMFFFSRCPKGPQDFTNVTHVDFWFYTDNVNIFKNSRDCGFQLSYTDEWKSGGVGVPAWYLRKLELKVGWNHLTLPLDFSAMTPDCDLTKIQRFRFFSVLTPSNTAFLTRVDEVRFANQPGLDNAEQVFADQVIRKIDAIGTVNHYSELAIAVAREAYKTLSQASKNLVTNYQKLVDAETAHAALMSGGGATVLPDDMMTKPQTVESGNAWKISGCDSTSAVSVYGVTDKRVVAIGEDQFTAFIARKNQSPTQITAKPSINIPDGSLENLAIKMQLYVSNADVIGNNGQLEITSSGRADSNEIHWSTGDLVLKNGWNQVYLEMKDGELSNGTPNFSNINYMRMYFFPMQDAVMAVDNIRIVERSLSSVKEDFETPASLPKWQSEATLSLEDGALKAQGDGEIAFSTDVYSLSVLQPDRTPFEFDLKADAPENVVGLTVEFVDASEKTAVIRLDFTALKADEFTHFMVVPSEMTTPPAYNFEVVKKVTIRVALKNQTNLWLDNVSSNQRSGKYWRDFVYDYTTTPGDYSIAVIPDIQELTAKYPDKLNTIMQWIVDNKTKENIQFAVDVGDLTWNGHNGNKGEFQTAANAFKKLQDAGIDYAIAYGNHDYQTSGTSRNTDLLNQYFPLSNMSTFPSFGGVSTEGKIDNMYQCFEVQGNKYMILSMEFDPGYVAITWANKVIKAHPDYQVIINTHNYMYDVYGQRSGGGETLWNSLVKKHKNIAMVLCGHECLVADPGSLNYRVDEGKYGNMVHQLMANSQDIDADRGGVGLLLMLRFRDGGQTVDVNYFSPVNDGLAYKEQNQFSITLSESQETLEEDIAQAKAVQDLIDTLPEVDDVNLSHKEVVDSVQQAYDDLTDGQKSLVTNYSKLEDAVDKIHELTDMSNEASALEVMDLIVQLPLPKNVTLEHEDAVLAAREAYNALTAEQQRWVDPLDLEKLEALEARLKAMKENYGDVNCDGIVDAVDALMVLRVTVGKIGQEQLTAGQLSIADVDGNEILNAVDALYILQKAVGKIDKFPVETVA
jgi:hypothetical protein